MFADVPNSTLALLHSLPHKPGSTNDEEKQRSAQRPAVLVDLRLCLNTEGVIPREVRSLVMVMGTLESCEKPQREIRKWLKRNASLGINTQPGLILEAILLRDAADINLQIMEEALRIRMQFDDSQG